MVSAAGAGTASVARYVLRLQGEQDSSVPRVFGRVSKSVQNVDDELRKVQGSLKEQRSELRGIRRGTEEYDRLSTEVERTERQVNQLTDELERQQRSWRRFNEVGKQSRSVFLGLSAGIGAGLGALLIQTDQVGRTSAQLQAISRETGLATEFIQRLQLRVRAVGEELDNDEFREINVRLGEAALLGTGTAAESLELLGFNARQVAAKDFPLILKALEDLNDRGKRQFLADEIFGGAIAERIIPTFDLSAESRANLNEVNVLQDRQIRQFAESRVEMEKLKGGVFCSCGCGRVRPVAALDRHVGSYRANSSGNDCLGSRQPSGNCWPRNCWRRHYRNYWYNMAT